MLGLFTCVHVHIGRAENNFQGPVLSFHHVGPRGGDGAVSPDGGAFLNSLRLLLLLILFPTLVNKEISTATELYIHTGSGSQVLILPQGICCSSKHGVPPLTKFRIICFHYRL